VALDLKAIQDALITRLPVRARWAIHGTPLDFDFSLARQPLHGLPDYAIESGDPEWSELVAFGEYDYAEGGGANPWLCVRMRDGSVCGFDGESERPIFLLNSSVEQFIATFRLLDQYLGSELLLPSDCEAQLRNIDPNFPTSDWRRLVDAVRGT
jgi:hypothetical protein